MVLVLSRERKMMPHSQRNYSEFRSRLFCTVLDWFCCADGWCSRWWELRLSLISKSFECVWFCQSKARAGSGYIRAEAGDGEISEWQWRVTVEQIEVLSCLLSVCQTWVCSGSLIVGELQEVNGRDEASF